jgi:hypothetical protein
MRTAPVPAMDASLMISKGSLKSGNCNTGASVSITSISGSYKHLFLNIVNLYNSVNDSLVYNDSSTHHIRTTDKFKNKTGRGILVNTSFNVRGEPIVCSPYDAYRCFMTTNIDYLVMNDFIYYKSNQPQNLHNWSKEFEKD